MVFFKTAYFTFHAGLELYFSLSKLSYFLSEFESRKIRQHLTNWIRWNGTHADKQFYRDIFAPVAVVVALVGNFTALCSVPWPLTSSDLVLWQTFLFFICKWSCSGLIALKYHELHMKSRKDCNKTRSQPASTVKWSSEVLPLVFKSVVSVGDNVPLLDC